MTTLDVRKLEATLHARAAQLVHSLAERNQITIERSADAFDATVLAAERENSAQTLGQEFRLLREVELALVRLREGSFGICQGCEEQITLKRLQAIPWAAYCVSCQQEEERGGTLTARPARAA